MVKTFGQKISLVFAGLCYLASVACMLGAAFHESEVSQDVIQASLLASMVFFLTTGIVLHVIGTARLKGIISGHVTDDPENESP